MKGQSHRHNTGNKGRSYGVVVLLAFGAAIFGVMTLHKFRDRRICNLFLKEKDLQLNTLQLLLQEEREHANEAKRQMEDMNSDIQWLRTQKMDLDGRIFELKTTISSLKAEQTTMEVALKEKQGEIKMLREKHVEPKLDDSQVTLLSEALKQKEAEIEDLKHHLQLLPVKVWSVSADDPSNFTADATGTEDDARRGSEELHDSIKTEDEEKLAQDIESSTREAAHKRYKDGTRQTENTKKDEEKFDEKKSKTGEDEGQTGNGEESYLHEKRYTNDDAYKDGKEHGTTAGEQGSFATSRGNNHQNGVNYEGVMKLEMQDNPKGRVISRVSVTNDYMKKTRGKRRQTSAKQRVDEGGVHPKNRGIASMRNRKFFKVKQATEKIERGGGSKLQIRGNQKDVEMRGKTDEDHETNITNKIRQVKDSETQINTPIRSEQGLKSDMWSHRMQNVSTNHDDSPPGKTWLSPNTTQKIEEERGREDDNTETEQIQGTRGGGSAKAALSKGSDISLEARNKIPDELTSTIREDTEPRQAHNLPDSSEYANIAERDVKEDYNQEVENYQEREEGDHPGGAQDTRNQKPDDTSRIDGNNNNAREGEEFGANRRHPSQHAKLSERDVKHNDPKVENDPATEEADNTTGSAASLREGVNHTTSKF